MSYGITLDLAKDKAILQSTGYEHVVNLAYEPHYNRHIFSITELAE